MIEVCFGNDYCCWHACGSVPTFPSRHCADISPPHPSSEGSWLGAHYSPEALFDRHVAVVEPAFTFTRGEWRGRERKRRNRDASRPFAVTGKDVLTAAEAMAEEPLFKVTPQVCRRDIRASDDAFVVAFPTRSDCCAFSPGLSRRFLLIGAQ